MFKYSQVTFITLILVLVLGSTSALSSPYDRKVRVLVAHSQLMFFFDKARIRGVSYDAFHEFEKYINKQLKTGRSGLIQISGLAM